MDDQDPTPAAPPPRDAGRRALVMGAVGASAVISIRPALAQTAASISTCEIPVPDRNRAAQYIAPDGSVVAPRTPGAYPGMTRPFRGEEVRQALNGGQLPGVDYERSRAYTAYIRRLQQGTSGFTCYASLQMPRR